MDQVSEGVPHAAFDQLLAIPSLLTSAMEELCRCGLALAACGACGRGYAQEEAAAAVEGDVGGWVGEVGGDVCERSSECVSEWVAECVREKLRECVSELVGE